MIKMNAEELKFVDDNLFVYTPLPQYGDGISKVQLVMTKEIFQECYKKWIEPQTNEILIKSAIRILVNEQIKQGSWGYALEEDSDYEVSWNDVLKWLEQQPKMGKGKWIGGSICNRCNYKKMPLWQYDYCPKCGAKMEEVENG